MEKALEEAPSQVVWGAGDDAFTLRHRTVEGDEPVFVHGGIQTLLYSSEEAMYGVYRDCCRCRAVAGVCGGVIPDIPGISEFRAGSPEEILPYRRSVELLRKAAEEAGRPGMVVENGAPTILADIVMYAGEGGLRPTDPVGTGGIAEMKTSMERLNRVAFALATGGRFSGANGSTIGGFCGSVEGAAIVTAASMYQCLLVNQGEAVSIKTTPSRSFSRATRKTIWICALAFQAVTRNTHLVMLGCNGDHPACGPGTPEYFYETVAGSLPCITGGSHKNGGTRKFNIGRVRDYGSPVESDFLGHACQAMIGVDLETANRAAVQLLSKYEDRIDDPPDGWTLKDLYDLDRRGPADRYRKVYDNVASELRDLGIAVENYYG
jgi:methylamine--corrinoid protein Co-methyltransferase